MDDYIEKNKGKMFGSDSFFAKLAFIILVLYLFIFLLKLFLGITKRLSGKSGAITLMKGQKNASVPLEIRQDPKVDGAKTVLRSVNEKSGLEFTYSVWIYIRSNRGGDVICQGAKRHIFNKGNFVYGQADKCTAPTNEQCPGLFLTGANVDELLVIISTFGTTEDIPIGDVPLRKWINIIITVQQKNVNTYINGVIKNSHVLQSLPRQNYGSVYITKDGGFDGKIADLKYWNYAVNPGKVRSIAGTPPSGSFVKTQNDGVMPSSYLGLDYYTSQ